MKPNYRNIQITMPTGDDVPQYIIFEKEEAFLTATGKPLFFDGFQLKIQTNNAKGTDYNQTFYHCVTEEEKNYKIRLLKQERLEKLELIEPLLLNWKSGNEVSVARWKPHKDGNRIWIVDQELDYTIVLKPQFDQRGWVRDLLIITAYPTRGKEKVHNYSHLSSYVKGELKNLYSQPKK